ncbi:MAG: hypothetical protein JKY92_09960 [Magnetovibrio sp.]|nr:hypothetical protein [Magnetovibrio sp.]
MPSLDSAQNTDDPVPSSELTADDSDQDVVADVEPFDPSVNFINSTVLDAKSGLDINMGSQIANQSAGMMIEDMRAFIQGNQQILNIAIAECLKKIVESDGANGNTALKDCTAFMTDMTVYIGELSSKAGAISKDFK